MGSITTIPPANENHLRVPMLAVCCAGKIHANRRLISYRSSSQTHSLRYGNNVLINILLNALDVFQQSEYGGASVDM
jgi:hypothetical protein